MALNGTHAGPEHRLERMIFFSDAVFAIAITLLIIEVHVPPLHAEATGQQWIEALVHLIPHFAAFLLSFLVIGALWASHHAIFSLVSGFDQRLIWPNLLLLLAVAFLPFSTGLIATGSTVTVPFVFYAASLLVAALLKARLTVKALAPELIAPGISPARVAVELKRRWVMPAAAVLTLLLAFVIPPLSGIGMALVPIARRLPMFRLPPEDAPAPSLH